MANNFLEGWKIGWKTARLEDRLEMAVFMGVGSGIGIGKVGEILDDYNAETLMGELKSLPQPKGYLGNLAYKVARYIRTPPSGS